MVHKVREILLVSSLYDYFIISEDGGLYEYLYHEYTDLGLSNIPRITRVSSSVEAMQQIQEKVKDYDLIIITPHLSNQHAIKLAFEIKETLADIPIVFLTWENRAPLEKIPKKDLSVFDLIFVWQGNFNVFLAIIKQIEDRLNIEHDTKTVGIQCILLVEDNAQFYSQFLPIMYREMVQHTSNLISEGVNQAHKQLRKRARAKVILCTSYEEAWLYFKTYRKNILGVVSDISFPFKDDVHPGAGFKLVKKIRGVDSTIPILFQSSDISNKEKAEDLGACFLHKNSDVMLHNLRMFMIHSLGFGNFIFRLSDGSVVTQVSDMREMETALQRVPGESIRYHANNNDFSKWLKVRTEHLFARKVRQAKASDYNTDDDLRHFLIKCFQEHFKEQQRSSIIDFDPQTFDNHHTFARLGSGSLGGKARGLAFIKSLISEYALEHQLESVRISVPASLVLTTDVFDSFMEENNLKDIAIHGTDDKKILSFFKKAKFNNFTKDILETYLKIVDYPLSVRSSSLLEDSHETSFAGVYKTLMIPNNEPSVEARLKSLLKTIKHIYASTYTKSAKNYLKSTPYRLEEEKMAIIIQKLIGSKHGRRFYPHFSGVGKSYNYYPIAPMKSEDGIASVALGLGKTVVEGKAGVCFCPKYPQNLVQFSNVGDMLKYAQKEFFALSLSTDKKSAALEGLTCEKIQTAKKDKMLEPVGSIYSSENDAVYDSLHRKGSPLVTFAPILKHNCFPLAEVLKLMLDVGEAGMSSPVEIEFASDFSSNKDTPSEFSILQMRPMTIEQDFSELPEVNHNKDDLFCCSNNVLGNGVISNIRDVITVDLDHYERSKSKTAAQEIALFNMELLNSSTPCILIGIGRWGSADPLLGIPVDWQDINSAKVIIEAEAEDMNIAPSQGTHFFHNLTSFRIGYFTVTSESKDNLLDWKWLSQKAPEKERKYTKHFRFDEPFTVVMDGKLHQGAIIKPPK